MNDCEECGKDDGTVTEVCDPFAFELNGEEWMRYLCSPCYGSRSLEV